MHSFIKKMLKKKNGNASVELACIFPIILLVIMFTVDRFMFYDGATSMTSVSNEVVRYVVTPVAASGTEGLKEAREAATTLLAGKDGRFASSGLGWAQDNVNDKGSYWVGCTSGNCDQLTIELGKMNTKGEFITTPLADKNNNTWCNGNYIKMTVKARKTSLMPSYRNFKNLLVNGNMGKFYHEYTYTVINRVETSNECIFKP